MSGWFDQMLNSRIAQNAIAAVSGVLFAAVLGAINRKMGRLEYSVTHNRLGISGQDAVMGNVQVTWQGAALPNLYVSVVEVVNATTEDFTDVRLRIYTGAETMLLNERTEVKDSPYIVTYSPEYQARISVPPGEQPTPIQIGEYRHNREYVVPVLNRGQRLVFRYMTTITANAPSVWVATLHKGLKVRFVPMVPPVLGVPMHIASLAGIIACLIILILCSIYVDSVLVAAGICLFAGLAGQPIGAVIVRSIGWMRRIIYH